MTTASALARSRYASESVTTASPARLLIMLYDRLVRDLVAAEQAIARRDLEAVNTQLVHAQAILLELNASLDVSCWDGGPGLSQLYVFCWSELVAANRHKDTRKVQTVRELLEPLRDAWQQAALTAAQQ